MNSVNLTPIDIPKKTFEVEDNLAFDSSKLDISCDKKKKKKSLKRLPMFLTLASCRTLIDFCQKTLRDGDRVDR